MPHVGTPPAPKFATIDVTCKADFVIQANTMDYFSNLSYVTIIFPLPLQYEEASHQHIDGDGKGQAAQDDHGCLHHKVMSCYYSATMRGRTDLVGIR